jgi:hypothetical protein
MPLTPALPLSKRIPRGEGVRRRKTAEYKAGEISQNKELRLPV